MSLFVSYDYVVTFYQECIYIPLVIYTLIYFSFPFPFPFSLFSPLFPSPSVAPFSTFTRVQIGDCCITSTLSSPPNENPPILIIQYSTVTALYTRCFSASLLLTALSHPSYVAEQRPPSRPRLEQREHSMVRRRPQEWELNSSDDDDDPVEDDAYNPPPTGIDGGDSPVMAATSSMPPMLAKNDPKKMKMLLRGALFMVLTSFYVRLFTLSPLFSPSFPPRPNESFPEPQ